MARFQKKILDPLTRDADSKLEQAQAVDDITDRADALVAARDDSESKFKKAIQKETLTGAGSIVTGILGGLATYLGYSTATSLIAVLAGTTGMAIPLAIAGAVVLGASIITASQSNANIAKLKDAWKTVSTKADAAITGLVAAHPEEAKKSSRLSAFLKRAFNPAASADKPAAQAAPSAPAPKAEPAPTR